MGFLTEYVPNLQKKGIDIKVKVVYNTSWKTLLFFIKKAKEALSLMKILVVCQYYYPEPFKISDTLEELVRRGHDVTVVTGTPNYPMGVIYSGYENGKRSDEVINGVKVHRCKIFPRGQGAINRLRNYFSFSCSSKKYVKTLGDDFDVVFVNQLSPVMMANAGIYYKKKFGKKLVMYTLDLWPESLKAGGIGEGNPLYKYFKKVSKRIYRSALHGQGRPEDSPPAGNAHHNAQDAQEVARIDQRPRDRAGVAADATLLPMRMMTTEKR